MAAGKLEWWAKVCDLTPDQVSQAFNRMSVGQDAWPPGPRAFRKLALEGQETRQGIHALYLPRPPAHPVSRERVLSDLASLKTLLPAEPVQEDALQVRISQADRRAFIERHREALLAAGLTGYVQEAELALADDLRQAA